MSESISVGNINNPRDFNDKVSAYRRLLESRISLNQSEARAFADKFKRKDAPYVIPLSEMPKYATAQEELADVGIQTQRAIKNARELLPRGNDALTFVQDTLRDNSVVDPLDPLNKLSEVALFNNYFQRFQEYIKGIKVFTPASLRGLWTEFLDSLSEDLLPKSVILNSIFSHLKQIKDATTSKDTVDMINALYTFLNTNRLPEKQYNEINRKLITSPSDNTILDIHDLLLPPKVFSLATPKGAAPPPLGSPPAKMGVPFSDNEFKELAGEPDIDVDDWKAVAEYINNTVPIAGLSKLKARKTFVAKVKAVFDKEPLLVSNAIKFLVDKSKLTKALGVKVKVGQGLKISKKQIIGKGVCLDNYQTESGNREFNKYKYSAFGKFKIHNERLLNNILSIYNLNSCGRPNIKTFQTRIDISDTFKELIKTFLSDEKLNMNLFYKLNDNEKRLCIQLFKYGGFLNTLAEVGLLGDGQFTFNGGDADRRLVERYELVKGQILAGNNNKELLDELVELANRLTDLGYMTRYRLNRIISEIWNLSKS
jgi:hypothetical protein